MSVFDTLVKSDFTHSAGGEFVGGTLVVKRPGDREGVGAVLLLQATGGREEPQQTGHPIGWPTVR